MLENMFRKTMIAIGGLVVSVSTTAAPDTAETVAKSPYDSYIVIMNLDPAIKYQGNIAGFAATKPAKGKRFNAKSESVKQYKRKLRQDHDKLLSTYGLHGKKVHDYSVAINGFSARMSHEQAKAIALNKKVVRVIPDELHQKQTDNSATFLGLNSYRGPWDTGITGEGVIVGVIDTGIWPEHSSFTDDGSYPDLGISLDESVYSACDFGNTAHREDDTAFTCNNKLLGARQILPTYRAVVGAEPSEFDSARDDDGHGTHTASTAAGNINVPAQIFGRDFGEASGVAHRARIIAYKALGTQGGFGSDLAAAIDQAVADGVDVINYSIGSSSYAIGPDDIAFLFAADAGVFSATSNGNSGPAPATTGSPASVPWVTSVGASTQNRTYEGSAQSVDGWEFFGASITAGTQELSLIDAADAGDELCAPGSLDAAMVAGKIVLCKRGGFARIDKSLAVYIAGGAGMILYNETDSQSQSTDTHHVPSVQIGYSDGLVIKDYIATSDNPTAMLNGGTYKAIEAPWMAAFSSRGPNRLSADIIKPDVTAPGVNILAGDTPVRRGELFQMISGTSMSSPHVAGLFALIKQVRPEWTPAMAKSALMTTAYQGVKKEDGVTPADAFDMGAGHVDPSGYPKRKGSMFNPGLVYDAGLLDYYGFLCGAETGLLTDATCQSLESAGIATDPSDLNLPSIGIAQLAGSQTVHRTVTLSQPLGKWGGKHNATKKYYAKVAAPEGYEVTVTPSVLELAPGESASYAVTINNVSAPVNEWKHGSLTWSTQKFRKGKNKRHKHGDGGSYTAEQAYSPIAVKGTLFATPDSVSGSGASGSANFDISFGYTGNYSASSHGLVPATTTLDAVDQDPDQAFDPNDGYSVAHTVTVSDAALLRFAMPPDATDANADIDLYLANPDGEIVASSGNGGTDEVIEIVAPTDGEWTLWVHGWSAPTDATAYTLYSWVIANTPDGNLNIDSAPSSAVIGNTETVDVSWSGADAGQWHLGVVSHSGDSGVIGLTRIDVDNR